MEQPGAELHKGKCATPSLSVFGAHVLHGGGDRQHHRVPPGPLNQEETPVLATTYPTNASSPRLAPTKTPRV